MKYTKYIKCKNYFDDTYIFMGMLLFSLIQRLSIDILDYGILMAAIVEIVMLVFIYCRIKKVKKVNQVLKSGQLVYGVYDKEYTNVLPYAGRGGAAGNFRFGFNYQGKIYQGWIELAGNDTMVDFIAKMKELPMPILIAEKGHYVLLEEFAVEEGIVPEKNTEKWVGNLVFGTVRYFVLMMHNLKNAFILEAILLGVVFLVVIYIKYIRPKLL